MANWLGYQDVKLGRQVFGNTTPATLNILGRLNGSYVRLRQKPAELDQARHYKRLGYGTVCVEHDARSLKELQAGFQSAVADPSLSEPHGDNLDLLGERFPCCEVGRRIENPENLPGLPKILNAKFWPVIEGCVGNSVRIVDIECYRTIAPPPKANFEVYANWWHCDQRRSDLHKVFINISDVTLDDGPFSILSRKDTAQALSSEEFNGREDADFEVQDNFPDARWIQHVGPVGSILVGNTQLCLHRAGLPAPSRHRDILVISVVDAAEPSPGFDPAMFTPGYGQTSRYTNPRAYGVIQ